MLIYGSRLDSFVETKKQFLMYNKLIFLTSLTVLILTLNSSRSNAQTNLNFESWSGNNPQGWFSSNDITTGGGGSQTVFQETADAIEGNSSLRLVTGSCPDCPNYLSNLTFGFLDCTLPDPFGGSVQLTGVQDSGIPYTNRPLSIDFKYKSAPVNNDEGGLHMTLTKYNPSTGESDLVGEAIFTTNADISSWTQVNVPVVYYSSVMPDTMNFYIASSIGSIMDCSNSIFFPGLSPYTDLGLPYPQAGSELFVDEIVINLPSCDGFSVTSTGTNESTFGAADGSATANPVGGQPPYNYSWNTLETTQTINNLIPGTYFVTVTDANQCQKVANYTVTPAGCNISVTMSGNNSSTSSVYSGTGSATAQVSGGSGSYEFVWNTGVSEIQSSSSSISNLPVGTYAVLIVDQNNPACAVWGYYTVLGQNGTSSIEEIAQNSFEIYPNPSSGSIKINCDTEKILSYRIIDLSGKAHKEGKLFYSGETIDISELSAGTYIVELSDGVAQYGKVLVVE